MGVVYERSKSKDLQDKERRNLLVATGGVGALGACAFVTPMVASFAPSVRAKASESRLKSKSAI